MSTSRPPDVRHLEEGVAALWRLSQEAAPEDFQAGALQVAGTLLPFASCRERGIEGASAGDSTEVVAVVDTQGRLYTPTPALEGLLHREWRGWRGLTLPSPLRTLCLEGGFYAGTSIAARVETPHSSFTRLHVRPAANGGAPSG